MLDGDMSRVNQDLRADARRIESALLQSLSRVGLDPVAEACGCDATTVGRWRDKELPRIAIFLALAGMKVVPKRMHHYRPETINAIYALAQERMDSIKSPAEDLAFEDRRA
jgi:hypothetical protein